MAGYTMNTQKLMVYENNQSEDKNEKCHGNNIKNTVLKKTTKPY